jgi:multimeric flavodoxin WrbA
MEKNILVLTGSPRKDGNSGRLADAFIRGAQAEGCRIHRFDAAFKKIRGCQGCNQCWSGPGPCVIQDDFAELSPLLETCSAVVLVSPVYFWGFTAQLKAAWDRFYCYLHGEGKKRFAPGESALLLTLGDRDDTTYRLAAETYRTVARYLGWNDRGVVAAKGLGGKADITGHEALVRAETLGRDMGKE